MALNESFLPIQLYSVNFDQIKQANETIKTTDIKGKNYAEVNQRIKAFRMVYPMGFIITEMLSNESGVCIFRAQCGYYENGNPFTLGIGTAYEKEGSSFINSTSYIENCETSAVGRALGMAGFGIDTSVASAEEVQNAMLNQEKANPIDEKKASPKQLEIISARYTGKNLEKLLTANKIEKLEDLPMAKASELISALKKKGD